MALFIENNVLLSLNVWIIFHHSLPESLFWWPAGGAVGLLFPMPQSHTKVRASGQHLHTQKKSITF